MEDTVQTNLVAMFLFRIEYLTVREFNLTDIVVKMRILIANVQNYFWDIRAQKKLSVQAGRLINLIRGNKGRKNFQSDIKNNW